MKPSRWGLHGLLFVLVSLALLPALGLAVYAGLEGRHLATEAAHGKALSMVRLAAAHHEQLEATVQTLLTTLSATRVIQEQDAREGVRLCYRLMRATPGVEAVYFVRPDGRRLFSSAGMRDQMTPVDQEFIRQVQENGGFVAGIPSPSPVTGRWALPYGLPVYSEADWAASMLAGVLVAEVASDYLTSLFSTVELPGTSTLSLVDDAGRILYRHPDPGRWQGHNLRPDLLRTVLASGREGTASGQGMDGIDRLYAFRQLTSGTIRPPLYLRLGLDGASAFHDTDSMVTRGMLSVVLLALTTMAVTRFVARRWVLRPAGMLTQAAQYIQRGFYDVDLSPLRGRGEFGRLGDAFEDMAAALAKRTEREQAHLESLREFASHVRGLLDATSDSVVLMDRGGAILECNEEAARKRGLRRTHMLGKQVFEFYAPDVLEGRRQAIETVIRTGKPFSFEENTPDCIQWVNFHPIFDTHHQVVQLASYARDITSQRQADEALCRVQERYRQLVENAPIGIYQSTADEAGRYLQVNRYFASMLGYDTPDQLMDGIADIRSQIYTDPSTRSEMLAIVHREGFVQDFEAENRRQGGESFWTMRTVRCVRDGKGRPRILEGFIRDITVQKNAQAQLHDLAYHDPLTGLSNRTVFLERLQHALERTNARHTPFATFFLDLDNFKLVNDTMGHHVGDKLLELLGRRLHIALGEEHVLARLGGDEFGVILPSLQHMLEAMRMAELVHKCLEEPFHIQGREIRVSTALGVVLVESGYRLPEDVLRDADIAMYRAKERGRAQTEVFNIEMYAALCRRVEMEHDLRRALALGELFVVYQPFFRTRDLSLAGFEALVRWRKPTGDVVSPVEFIPVAEESGLILDLGEYVLREACARMQGWQERHCGAKKLVMNVNFSSKQLYLSDPLTQVREALAVSHVAPACLFVEITESILMEDMQSGMEILKGIRRLGVGVALDDFGTGYSSLGYLRELPLDELKMDRAFVQGLDRPGRDRQIVDAIVSLAHGLDFGVIAEGVENEAILGVLVEADCDLVQGFLMARPLGGDQASELVARHCGVEAC